MKNERLYHWDWCCKEIVEGRDYVIYKDFERFACTPEKKLEILSVKLCTECLIDLHGLYG